jgi:hypothetical protein
MVCDVCGAVCSVTSSVRHNLCSYYFVDINFYVFYPASCELQNKESWCQEGRRVCQVRPETFYCSWNKYTIETCKSLTYEVHKGVILTLILARQSQYRDWICVADWVPIHGRGKRLVSSWLYPDQLWGPSNFRFIGYQDSPPPYDSIVILWMIIY